MSNLITKGLSKRQSIIVRGFTYSYLVRQILKFFITIKDKINKEVEL
jgi:hypothetical protein